MVVNYQLHSLNVSCVIPAMQVRHQIKHKAGLLSYMHLLHLLLELNLEKFLPTKKLQDWNSQLLDWVI